MPSIIFDFSCLKKEMGLLQIICDNKRDVSFMNDLGDSACLI